MASTRSRVVDAVDRWVGEPLSPAEVERWLLAQPSHAEDVALLEHREHVGKDAFRLHPAVSRRFRRDRLRRAA